MSQKDELLRNLTDTELLRLAISVSKAPLGGNAGRRDLLKRVKSSLSVEEIKQKIRQIQVPLQSKRLARNELFTGGIGQVFLTIWGFTSALIYNSFSSFSPPYLTSPGIQTLSIWSMIGAAFFFLFAILNATSMILIHGRLRGNKTGIISAMIALVTSLVGIIYYIFSYMGLTYDTSKVLFGPLYSINGLGISISFVYNILLAVTMILVGVFFFFCRECFSSILSVLGGLLFVLAGAFQLNYNPGYTLQFSYYYAIFGVVFLVSSPLSFAAAVVGASCFFSTRLTD